MCICVQACGSVQVTEGSLVFANKALVAAQPAMYLTSYSHYPTDFCEPLSPPYGCLTGQKHVWHSCCPQRDAALSSWVQWQVLEGNDEVNKQHWNEGRREERTHVLWARSHTSTAPSLTQAKTVEHRGDQHRSWTVFCKARNEDIQQKDLLFQWWPSYYSQESFSFWAPKTQVCIHTCIHKIPLPPHLHSPAKLPPQHTHTQTHTFTHTHLTHV